MAGSSPSKNSKSLQEVERRLQEKEELLEERNRTVLDLTDRLSRTVEKLDRYKRGGSDQGVIRMATFPKEVVDQQTELVDDLKRAVELWENMQLSCGLGRLESQLTDLHSLFKEHFQEEEPEPEEPEVDELSLEDDEEAEDELDDELEQEDEAGLFDDEEEPEPIPAPSPEILDPVKAGDGELRRCVDQQEAYIDYLSARLRRATKNLAPIEWDELSGDPQKITQELQETVAWVEESRQFAEFETALQHSRLKRTERDLAQLTAELEQQMLALDPSNQATEEEEGGGWLRMLGMK